MMGHDEAPDQGGTCSDHPALSIRRKDSHSHFDKKYFLHLLDYWIKFNNEQQEIDLSAMQQRVARPKYLMLDDTFVHGGCHGVLVSLLGIIILHSVLNSENIWSSL